MNVDVDIEIDCSPSTSGTEIVTGRPPGGELEIELEDSQTRMITSAPPSRDSRSRRNTPRVSRSKPALGQPKTRPVRLLPGRRVPGTRYRLVRWLGEGGMGVVYEAEHEDIERRVALKILRPDASSDPVLAARFREEARAASKVGSPHIVEIFDFGELPDGRLMFAMEHLPGHGLDTQLDQVPLPQSRIIAILRQVCKGLAAAHEVGIIHCDVKPDNVLLLNQKERSDFTKLVDFGIARVMTDASNDGAAAGTPHYMAPEQIEGAVLDGRADIYALGCMAYELYTGTTPFSGQSVEDILDNHLHAPIPSVQGLLPGQIHPAMEAVIQRCLAKNADERYRDMHDLEAALCEAQIAAGIITQWDDLGLPLVDPERLAVLRRDMPRPDKPVDRRRWLWPAIAAASTLVAVATTLIMLAQPEPTPEEKSRIDVLVEAAVAAGSKAHWIYGSPEAPEDTSYVHVYTLDSIEGPTQELADSQAQTLRSAFSDSLTSLGDYYWDREGGTAFARDYYIQACLFLRENQHACERTGVTVGELAELRNKASAGTFSKDDLQSAKLLVALAEPDETKRDQQVAQVMEEARERGEVGAMKNSYLRRSVDRLRPARVAKASTTGGRRSADGNDADTLSDPESATPAVAEPGRTRPTRDPQRARELVEQAQVARRKGKRAQATKLYNQALAVDNRNHQALIGLSDLAFDRSKFSEAVKYARKATDASPRRASYRIKLGDAYYKLLRYRDAHSQYQRAKDLGSKDAKSRLLKVRDKLPK